MYVIVIAPHIFSVSEYLDAHETPDERAADGVLSLIREEMRSIRMVDRAFCVQRHLRP